MDPSKLPIEAALVMIKRTCGCSLTYGEKYRVLEVANAVANGKQASEVIDDLGQRIEDEFKLGNPTATLKELATDYFQDTFKKTKWSVNRSFEEILKYEDTKSETYRRKFTGLLKEIDYCLKELDRAANILPDGESQVTGEYGYEGAKVLLLGYKGQILLILHHPSKWNELTKGYINVANALLERDFQKAKGIISGISPELACEINQVLKITGMI